MTLEPGTSSIEDVVGAWSLDPAATTIEFQTKAMWVLPVKGHFRAQSGSGTVGEDGSVTGSITIDAASVDTGNRKRDDHLRTADFFEVETYPTFTFEVTSATVSGTDKAAVEGSLTIKGAAHPVKADVSFARSADAVDLDVTVADLDRREWGITWAKLGAGVHNRLSVHAHFVRS